ncbi:MAG: AAA family ATPase [Coxiella sp. RIFCSPHIGHO2_12_FULL_42_15]|nr:MAG: AAA family ATPase [Coxiella sp. RIFCSPHIGHO2_12_FULL_42_15]
MIERILGSALARLAKQYPVITLTGPRQSGKTTLCKAMFSSHDYMSLEDLNNRSFATDDPRGFLAQFKNGVVLDEIQRAPDLLSYIQGIVDEVQLPGQFILTGSQQFEVTHTINQSLAGRTAILRLLPLAYSELYPSLQRPEIDTLLYQGFYPRIHDKQLNPTEALGFYLNTYIERDLRRLINIKNLTLFERFLKICASQIGKLTNYSHLANDCGITQNTVKEWLSLLEASYIIFQLRPHFENFRKRLTKSSKLYFYDVGLAAYLLGISDSTHVKSNPMRGELFENFIISEFLKNRFNHVKDNNLYFFRDHAGNEIDLILDYGSQLVSAEIKSGKTISSDYFKGVNYYYQLCEAKNKKRIVIYSGEKSIRYKEVEVYSYFDLEKLFDDLKMI